MGAFIATAAARASRLGAGLGLTIVKRIWEAARGEIAVERSARGGARFTIRIPCSTAPG